MRRTMFGFLLAGCGSLGLQSVELTPIAGELDATPRDEVDFGSVIADDEVAFESLKLKVVGDVPVRVVAVWVESSAGVFAIEGNPPIPRTMEKGQQIRIDLSFEPGAKGNFSGTFFAEASDGTLLERYLSGKGCGDSDDNGRCD